VSLPSLNHTLSQLGRSYLVVDVHCLFVAASLREEVWLYSQREEAELLAQVCQRAEAFRIRDVNPDRELVTYSGGEQAILACLLILVLIRALDLKQLQLLLCGVLESISHENRKLLCRHFRDAAETHGVGVHHMRDNQISELAFGSCAF